MKLYRVWRDLTAIGFHGHGYKVDFASNGAAVKYHEGSRSITLSSEPVAQGGAQWMLDVYIHRALKWDSPSEEEVTDTAQEELILSRVEAALKAKIGKYRFVREAI